MQLDGTRPWRLGIDRCPAARRAGGGDGAADDAARRGAAMGVAGSGAAPLRGEQAAARELPVMQLDTTRPWASWDRPLLCCEASRRRQWSCRWRSSTRRSRGRRGIDRCSAARRAGGGEGAAGDAARRAAATGRPRARSPAPAAGALPAIARRGACSDVSCDVRASDTCTDCSGGSTLDEAGACVSACPATQYGVADTHPQCLYRSTAGCDVWAPDTSTDCSDGSISNRGNRVRLCVPGDRVRRCGP